MWLFFVPASYSVPPIVLIPILKTHAYFMNWAYMSYHHKFLGLSPFRNWSLANSFFILVVVKGSSEGVTLSFDINWWTLKLIITLLGFRTAEIRKMNFRRWIHWKEMWLQSHYCWRLRVPWLRDIHTECNKGSGCNQALGSGGEKGLSASVKQSWTQSYFSILRTYEN